MSENKTIGRKSLTEQEKKIRDDENFKVYQKNISERNKTVVELENKIKMLNKSDWMKSKPTGESGDTKFIRLAKKRMTKTIKALDTLINLSGSQYKYTPEQVTKITETLKAKVTEIENSFGKVKQTNKKEFDF